MEKLKICHVSLTVFPDAKDGSAKYERSIFDNLKKRGHDITLLTGKWGDGFQDPDIHALDIPQSRFLWLPKFVLKYRTYLKKNDFDIIQGNGSRGSIPIMLSGKPYLTHIHDVGTFEASFTNIPGLKYLEKRNAKKSERIMCCADSAAQDIHKYMNVPLDKITNVSSAIEPTFKPEPEKASVLKDQLGLKGPVIFYVGRIAFYKGVEDIIKAYRIAKKQFPDLNLIIGGKPTLKMESAVSQWKIENPDVKFMGMIPNDEMAAYYSMADIFTTYSFASEGFGLTPVEALACGTPVICSTMPAYREVLKDHAVFVEPKNPNGLADAYVNQLNHPEIGLNKVKSAVELLKNYTWDFVTDKIERVYSEYLKNK